MKSAIATGLVALALGLPVSAQTSDLMSNREIVEIVVSGFIAETMAANCGNVIMPAQTRLDLRERGDDLARFAGRTPEQARAEISRPENERVLQGMIMRDLGRMGVPDGDIAALCRVAGQMAGGTTPVGSLLVPAR